ncbi:unnamed protein product [Camellia sinensis]
MQRNLVVGTKRAICQSMANALATSVLVILFCVLPLVADDGICQSMVVSQGYVFVTTKDGYILGMQRIPVGRSGKKPDRPPVLLQHGLLDAITWLLNPPGESLGFILADNGFDVWPANSRGTKSSRGHKLLSPSDAAYWDWSWDELAAYDLPASFQSAALLAPLAYLGQMPSPFARVIADGFIAEVIDFYLLGFVEFAPGGEAAARLLKFICDIRQSDCADLMTAVTGKNCCLDASRTDIFLENEPQSSATKNLIHLAQMIRQGTLAMYDYGNEDENNIHYGQPAPPVYNTASIPNDLPLFLSYGGQDLLSDVNGVQTLLDTLKDHDAYKLVFAESDGARTKLHPNLVAGDGICKSMVESQGYVCEHHKVTTKDGYILGMQRIPVGRSGKKPDKPPVLLQHGLLVDSITWLLNSPDESLAFILADNGFDAYWDWSWDELVAYDLPATFNYVSAQTGQNMHYVGHSLGTLIAFAAFSQKKLVNMLRSAALLSPIAYLSQMSSPLAKAAADAFIAEDLYWLGLNEFIPGGDAAAKLLKDICDATHSNCADLMTAFTGKNCCFNSSKTDTFLEHEPQPTATKNMIHIAQMVRQGTIAMYDYGSEVENNQHYGQPIPPVYNMASIPNDLPLFLSYGGQDLLSDVKDVKTLLATLKGHHADKLVVQYREDYAHADFVFGVNAKQVVTRSADGARTKLHPSLAASDGICQSMVESQGYVCEHHKVTTKDGYILGVQRIPVGRSGKKPDKPPVLLQHGLLVDSVTWLLNSPDESLAFVLADNGFDVWIANTRGTISSLGHTSLSPNDAAYWDWSWDELVAYDLPATFNYVHAQTGQNMHYVGHSLGTLIALAAFSQKKLVNMLRSAAMLSPIAYLGQMSSLLTRAAADAFLAEYSYWLGISEFIPEGDAAAKLLKVICDKTHSNCADLVTAFTGKNCCVNNSKTGTFLEHEPQPTATKTMIHLSQMIRWGTIAMYDYGSKFENNQHYGKPTPPVYNMASIPKDLPLFLSHGGQDLLSDVKDVKTLLATLKGHRANKLVVQYRKDYAHSDFVFGVNANKLVYDPLMAFFKRH